MCLAYGKPATRGWLLHWIAIVNDIYGVERITFCLSHWKDALVKLWTRWVNSNRGLCYVALS